MFDLVIYLFYYLAWWKEVSISHEDDVLIMNVHLNIDSIFVNKFKT